MRVWLFKSVDNIIFGKHGHNRRYCLRRVDEGLHPKGLAAG